MGTGDAEKVENETWSTTEAKRADNCIGTLFRPPFHCISIVIAKGCMCHTTGWNIAKMLKTCSENLY